MIIKIIILLIAALIAVFSFAYPFNNQIFIEATKEYVETSPRFFVNPTVSEESQLNVFLQSKNSGFLVTEKDFLNATVSLVRANYSEDFNNKIFHTVYIFYLNRTGFNTWQVENMLKVNIESDFKDIVKLSERYDISKDFPNKDNYKINNQELQTETDAERRKDEFLSELAESQQQIQEIERRAQTYPYLKVELDKIYSDDITSEDKITLIENVENIVSEAKDSFEKGDAYTFPDGNTVESSQLHIEDMNLILESLQDLK
jgi:hypothetical protein